MNPLNYKPFMTLNADMDSDTVQLCLTVGMRPTKQIHEKDWVLFSNGWFVAIKRENRVMFHMIIPSIVE